MTVKPLKAPEYPTELTVKYWNKKKGLLARISKVKTGITEELNKTEKLFDAIPWNKLNLHEHLSLQYNRDDVEVAMKKLQSETTKPVTAAYHGMRDLENFLTNKAKEMAREDKTKGFAKDVEGMADAAKKFSFAIAPGTLSDTVLAQREEALNSIKVKEDLIAKQGKVFKGYVVTALKATIAAQNKPMTTSDYVSHWSENLRGIGAACKVVAKDFPELQKPLKTAGTQWAQDNLPDDDEAVAKQLKADLVLLKEFGEIAKKVPG